ncbi:MAG: MBL fold metallo-hydrolase [Clostridia bacterium]|nr:MBL fold metallo-hydrolase [Clostridia bacterium]
MRWNFKFLSISVAIFLACSTLAGCNQTMFNANPKPATEHTAKVNDGVYRLLDFEDQQEREFALRGRIDAPETLEIKDENGNVIWSQQAYSFLDETEKAPASVNPSLWENSKNNHVYGLFQVTDGIYQVRGYDMANLTVIEGNSGRIVFDPLMTTECSKAAMELVEKNLGQKPIKAVIISHPHIDHFGGIKGVVSEEEIADSSLSIEAQIASGKIPIIVPEHFTAYAVSENVYAGKAMSRRANYQYGVFLEPGLTGKMAIGIGMGQSTGGVSFIKPTYEIKATGERITIDGVEMEFQMTPGTEAPAEMNIWIPQKNALWLAENCTATLHNLYTLRGAQVRDGNEWSKYILEAISQYGKDTEVTFQSHNWPHWGNDVILKYLEDTAAVYKFINDQTLTYINQGYTADEISNRIELPEPLAKNWYTRQYYGTVAHNSKAVYQKYMGWYDANPVNLNPLSPTDSAKKWVEYLGDTDKIIKMAKEDFDKGEYQWVAEITNVLVYADPENKEARLLCADALEQLGYQAESGAWRNAYLSAAAELRNGNLTAKGKNATSDGGVQKNMTAEMIFDYMGIVLNKKALVEQDFKVNFSLVDTKEVYTVHFRAGVMLVYKGALAEDAKVSVTCPKNGLLLILQRNSQGIQQYVKIDGDKEYLDRIIDNLTEISTAEDAQFNIIEP